MLTLELNNKYNFVLKKKYSNIFFKSLFYNNIFYFNKNFLYFYKRFKLEKSKSKFDVKNFKLKYLKFLKGLVGNKLIIYFFQYEKFKKFSGKIVKIFHIEKNKSVNFIVLDLNSKIILKMNLNNLNILFLLFY